jgi:hypothetical protein
MVEMITRKQQGKINKIINYFLNISDLKNINYSAKEKSENMQITKMKNNRRIRNMKNIELIEEIVLLCKQTKEVHFICKGDFPSMGLYRMTDCLRRRL